MWRVALHLALLRRVHAKGHDFNDLQRWVALPAATARSHGMRNLVCPWSKRPPALLSVSFYCCTCCNLALGRKWLLLL